LEAEKLVVVVVVFEGVGEFPTEQFQSTNIVDVGYSVAGANVALWVVLRPIQFLPNARHFLLLDAIA
jgi:hypothetical protein